MSTATRIQTDFTTQEATAYKTAIDGNCLVDGRVAGIFAAHAQSTPDMTVRVDAGVIPGLGALHTEVAAQNTGAITAPSVNPRNDIVYIDQLTGAVGVATGAEAATPSDPSVPSGKISIARVVLATSTTSITNGIIDDLRAGLDWLGLGSGAFANGLSILVVYDQKTQNTDGGTFTSGAWRTRDLNTVQSNTISGASLSSNQITLPAGDYYCSALAPAYLVNEHQTRLYDTTGASVLIVGSSEFNTTTYNIQTTSACNGAFTLSTESVIELQHQCNTTHSTNGLGVGSNFTTERFAEVTIWKV